MYKDRMFAFGASFEGSVRVKINDIPNTTSLHSYNVWSYARKRPTETDLLVITPYKILSVECKGVKGLLKGQFNDVKWIAKTGNKTMRIGSPIFQNFKHIRAIRDNLRARQLPVYEIENIICVPDNCTLFTGCKEVLKLQDLENYIENMPLALKPVYDVDLVYEHFKSIEVKEKEENGR